MSERTYGDVLSKEDAAKIKIKVRKISAECELGMRKIFGRNTEKLIMEFSICLSTAPEGIEEHQDMIDTLFTTFCAGVMYENQQKLEEFTRVRASDLRAYVFWSIVVVAVLVGSNHFLHLWGYL